VDDWCHEFDKRRCGPATQNRPRMVACYPRRGLAPQIIPAARTQNLLWGCPLFGKLKSTHRQ